MVGIAGDCLPPRVKAKLLQCLSVVKSQHPCHCSVCNLRKSGGPSANDAATDCLQFSVRNVRSEISWMSPVNCAPLFGGQPMPFCFGFRQLWATETVSGWEFCSE